MKREQIEEELPSFFDYLSYQNVTFKSSDEVDLDSSNEKKSKNLKRGLSTAAAIPMQFRSMTGVGILGVPYQMLKVKTN